MKTYKILWIDDEFGVDNTLDEIITNANENLSKHSISLDVKKITKYDEKVTEELESDEYKLFITDVKIGDNMETFTFSTALAKKQNIHYIIYSSFLGKVKHKNTNDLCVSILEKNEDITEIVNIITDFFKSPPFRILHLTDLHFDSTEIHCDTQFNTINSLITLLKELKKERKFDFAVFTGDIANRNVQDDHNAAYIHLDKIRTVLFDKQKDRLLIIPGNHDCLWHTYTSENKTLASKPWDSYLAFWTKFYKSTKKSFGDTYPVPDFQKEYNSDELSWHIEFKEPKVSFIGISSTLTSSQEAGAGAVTQNNLAFLLKYWKHPSEAMRILLLHHNLIPTISYNQNDEKSSIIKLGDLLNTLRQTNCKLVLSGHTHNSNLIKLHFAEYFDNSKIIPYEFVSISAGSCGGIHPAGDRKKTFNVIDIGYSKTKSSIREIRVTPYLYNSKNSNWFKSSYDLKDEVQ